MNNRHPNKEITSIKRESWLKHFHNQEHTLYQHNIQKNIQVSKIIDGMKSPELSSLTINHWS